MSEKKNELTVQGESQIDESAVFSRVSSIIENRKFRAQSKANQENILMFWEIGKYIGSVLLEGQRSEYGKQILVTLSQELQAEHGSCFEYSNITRMVKFANRFPDIETIAELASQLSWSHFIALLPLKTDEAFMYYAKDASLRLLSVRELRNQISRKAFERKEIADTQLSETSAVPLNMFKDPYLLDVLGLKENYLEADLEKAILADLEAFILEFGHGFTFVKRQKRMTMDGVDFTLDLLFYHRILKRLVAVELKIGEFKPSYSGQMRFYLKWLNRFERQEGENPPIGLILCTEACRDQIELMELDKEGIAVAEYWTAMPPKVVFEKKIKEIFEEAQERLERRKMLPNSDVKRDIEYFYEAKYDE